MCQFENVTISKRANVYFDGKCVSHSITLSDGSKKSVGVIFPSVLTFNTEAPETMELNSGKCRVKIAGDEEWSTYVGGNSFEVPGNSSFAIEILEMVDYTCHYG